MDYDLAKQLKDAGFPFKRSLFMATGETPENVLITERGVIQIPTLSELIEACGDKFHQLTYFKKDNLWVASAQWNSELNLYGRKTPEEAVAHLWLTLNKK